MTQRLRTLALLCLTLTAAAFAQEGVSDVRFNHLRRGINLSHWFAQAIDGKYTPEHLDTHTTPADLALIRRLGFDHVRLTIEPAPMWDLRRPEAIPADYLARLERAVDAALGEGLGVILDIHPGTNFKKELERDNRHVQAFADFWRTLAAHFARKDPERLFFEVINEPEFEDAYRWMGAQARLVSAIRASAPRHTIIVTGHRWSSLYEFLHLAPLADRNLVYNFHFYDPHIFTHQGATWGSHIWHYLKGLPYPSTPQNIEPLLEQTPFAWDRLELKQYGLDQWNAARIEATVAEAARWGRQHGVRLTCNEFGVFREAPAGNRARWLHDVRTALEKHGIGWTMWDYSGSFGVVTKDASGKASPDTAVLDALGLIPAR